MNGSQREGCKRLLAKVNGVDAQVQQEALPSPFFLADSLAAVPRVFSSHASLFLKVNELLSFREGKTALRGHRRITTSTRQIHHPATERLRRSAHFGQKSLKN